MIKGIIFDHDGTLIDTERMHYECWHLILRDYGVEFTLEEYVREHNGVPTSRNAEVLIQTYGIDIAATELVARKTAMAHTQFAAQPSPLMPFAAETLQRCFDAGHSLAIATGAGHAEIGQTMTAYNLRQFFTAIVTRDDVEQNKPAPDVYLLAQEKLGLTAQDCIAVEDTQAGICAAKDAGLRCIAVSNAYSSGQDLSAADAQCKNLAQAYKLIQTL